jgi:hypothetical protein
VLTLRRIRFLRKKGWTEEVSFLAVYVHALGMLDEAPEPQVLDAAE